jgi:RNA polymerase sigma-70 factor (ECF subfamily)
MTPSSPPPADARVLLEHALWMRRLARTLVHDSERAEDLAQETWTRILERPPALDRPFRGWIATVMRNLLRAEHRGAVRRAAREQASARPEAEPSSHELVERAALQREMVAAVLELSEPYRTTVLLRYFDDHTPSEIAARERIPVATVKTRLARGIAQLRERLGRTRTPDGRASVLLALARLESPPVPTALAWTALPLAMNAKILCSLLALVAAGLAYLYYERAEEPARKDGVSVVQAEQPAPLTAPAGFAPAEPAPAAQEGERRPLEVERGTLAATPPATSAAERVRGRVIDVGGAPVPGVRVALLALASPPTSMLAPEARATEVLAHSAADGSFELDGPLRGQLIVSEASWTTLLAGVPVNAGSGQESRIVVAPRVELSGVVLDEAGAPLAGAELTLVPPAQLRAGIAQVLDFSIDVRWTCASDELGRFRFESAPAIAEGTLRAELDGYRTHEEPAPLATRADLVLVLTRPDSALLSGTVVDPAGAPVDGALVAHGLDTARTDERGRFTFQLDDPHSINREAARFLTVRDDLLRALKPGFLPAELRAAERDAEGRPRWPAPLVLRLGGEALTIEGRVQDERGEPLAGLRVWIADPTLFGALREGGRSSEGPQMAQLENLLGGREPGWAWTESKADGRFELTGLTERDYVLAAMDPETLLRTLEPAVAAGRRDVVLVLRTGELFPRLAGRIVDSHGDPVPGAAVFPMCDAFETRLEGRVIQTQHEVAATVATDADGRFELRRVPKDLVYLRIQGSDVIPLEWGRQLEGGLARLVGESAEELTLTVERRCHFQVELEVPAEADQVGVLDADGNELTISEFHGNGRNDMERHALIEGRSATLAVGDRAATLVLYRAGGEVRRVGIRLHPGTPTQLRL